MSEDLEALWNKAEPTTDLEALWKKGRPIVPAPPIPTTKLEAFKRGLGGPILNAALAQSGGGTPSSAMSLKDQLLSTADIPATYIKGVGGALSALASKLSGGAPQLGGVGPEQLQALAAKPSAFLRSKMSPEGLQTLEQQEAIEQQARKEHPVPYYGGTVAPLLTNLGIGGARVAARKLGTGLVKPSPAGKALYDLGAKGLTVGEMAPGSTAAQLEEAAQSSLLGRAVQGQREIGKESWQKLVTDIPRAPGAPLPTGTDMAERLSQAYQSFEPAYGELKGLLVEHKPITNAFRSIASQKGVFATTQARNTAKKILDEQLTILNGRVNDIGRVPSEAVLEMRSNLRATAEEYLNSTIPSDRQIGTILTGAKNNLTDRLETALQGYKMGTGQQTAADYLRSVDKKYAQYKIVEDTLKRAGDQPGSFSPAQLSQSVRAATPAGPYARGEGGALRDLARLGRETLDMRSPPTGARLAALVPGIRQVSPLIPLLMNSPGIKPWMLGLSPSQAPLLRLAESLRPIPGATTTSLLNAARTQGGQP